MKQSQLPGKFLIPGLFMLFLALAGSAQAAPSVDLVLILNHSSPDLSPQLPLYNFSEPVAVNVTLINHGPGSITIIGYPPRVGISYRSQQDFRTFKRSCETLVLEPDQSTSFLVTWDQNDEHGVQVDSGLYTIAVYYLLTWNGNGSYDLSHLEPYSRSLDLMILPRVGAYQGDIIVNQSATSNNITATLESLHLSNTSGWANVTIHVPEEIPYMIRNSWIRCYVDDMLPEAQYSLDHTAPRQFPGGTIACDPRQEPYDIHMTYEFEPIPSDAESMDINLSSTGSIPWSGTYHVNLSTMSGFSRAVPDRQPAPIPATLPILAIACIIFIAAIRKQRKE